MNSTLQQLYMHPKIRALILQAPVVPESDRTGSVFHQLRQVFACLSVGRRSRVYPNGFWGSFKDYDGQDLNIKEHQVRTSQPPNHPSHLPTALLTTLSH